LRFLPLSTRIIFFLVETISFIGRNYPFSRQDTFLYWRELCLLSLRPFPLLERIIFSLANVSIQKINFLVDTRLFLKKCLSYFFFLCHSNFFFHCFSLKIYFFLLPIVHVSKKKFFSSSILHVSVRIFFYWWHSLYHTQKITFLGHIYCIVDERYFFLHQYISEKNIFLHRYITGEKYFFLHRYTLLSRKLFFCNNTHRIAKFWHLIIFRTFGLATFAKPTGMAPLSQISSYWLPNWPHVGYPQYKFEIGGQGFYPNCFCRGNSIFTQFYIDWTQPLCNIPV